MTSVIDFFSLVAFGDASDTPSRTRTLSIRRTVSQRLVQYLTAPSLPSENAVGEFCHCRQQSIGEDEAFLGALSLMQSTRRASNSSRRRNTAALSSFTVQRCSLNTCQSNDSSNFS